MTAPAGVTICTNPPISPSQLFKFYQRNNICEANFGEAVAAKVLTGSSLIVAAFEGHELVGIARAMFDGLSAAVMELSVDLRHQGPGGRCNNGSVVEVDASGLARALGERLTEELWKMGGTFITDYIVENAQEKFFESLGFKHNHGHLVYYIDRRPYVNKDDRC